MEKSEVIDKGSNQYLEWTEELHEDEERHGSTSSKLRSCDIARTLYFFVSCGRNAAMGNKIEEMVGSKLYGYLR